MKKPRKSTLLATMGILILVVALGVTAVFAQEAEEEAAPDSESTTPAPLPFHGGFKRGSGSGSFSPGVQGFGQALEGITSWGQALADALDIPLEELEDAQAVAYDNWLAEMVAAGHMEQEQAELMSAYNALKGAIDRGALMAQALGLSEAELSQAMEDGKRLSEILEDQGLTVEDFAGAMQETYEAAVQAEVGKSITQEQADAILSSGVGMRGFGHGGFGHGGHGCGGMRTYGGMRGSSGMIGFGFGGGTQGFGPGQFGPSSSGA